VDTTSEEISAAFRIEDEARIGFWDALIVAGALKAGADRILSEDLNPGQTISGVRIENPFARVRRRVPAAGAVNTLVSGRTDPILPNFTVSGSRCDNRPS
jgi:hypothetical protein